MSHRRVGPEGCRYGHGPERMHHTPDGYWRCRTCQCYAAVLQAARRLLPDLPPLHEFVAEHGFEAIDRMRLAMRKPPSAARVAPGVYRYAALGRSASLDDQLAHRDARPMTAAFE